MFTPSQRILTYPSIKAILHRFSIEKRTEIVRWIPALRKTNKLYAFKFDTVELVDEPKIITVRLDTLVWDFRRDGESKGIVENPWNVIREVEDMDLCVYRLLQFYLHGSKIKQLNVNYFPLYPDVFLFRKIGSLKVIWTERESVEDDLKVFCEVPVGVIEVHAPDFSDEWVEQITNLQCKRLRIEDKVTTLEKFQQMCQKFKDEQMEIGSLYSSWFEDDWDVFWENLKEKLRVEDDTLSDFFVTKTSNPGINLIVRRWEEKEGFRCKVEVVDSGTVEERKQREVRQQQLISILQWIFCAPVLFTLMISIFSVFTAILTVFAFQDHTSKTLIPEFLSRLIYTSSMLIVICWTFIDQSNCFTEEIKWWRVARVVLLTMVALVFYLKFLGEAAIWGFEVYYSFTTTGVCSEESILEVLGVILECKAVVK